MSFLLQCLRGYSTSNSHTPFSKASVISSHSSTNSTILKVLLEAVLVVGEKVGFEIENVVAAVFVAGEESSVKEVNVDPVVFSVRIVVCSLSVVVVGVDWVFSFLLALLYKIGRVIHAVSMTKNIKIKSVFAFFLFIFLVFSTNLILQVHLILCRALFIWSIRYQW